MLIQNQATTNPRHILGFLYICFVNSRFLGSNLTRPLSGERIASAIRDVYFCQLYSTYLATTTSSKSLLFGSWWSMVTHLGWSLLGVSEESDPMASVDLPSVTIARILYAAFLIFAVILLLNMLIALLCNTWQRTEVRGDISTRPFTIVRFCPPNAHCCCYMCGS